MGQSWSIMILNWAVQSPHSTIVPSCCMVSFSMLFWLRLGLQRSRHTFSMARSPLVWSIHSSPELANLISWWGLRVQHCSMNSQEETTGHCPWHRLAISCKGLHLVSTSIILYYHDCYDRHVMSCVLVQGQPCTTHVPMKFEGSHRLEMEHGTAHISTPPLIKVCHLVIRCRQSISVSQIGSLWFNLIQIHLMFDRSHFGTRPNCKRWSCPASVLRFRSRKVNSSMLCPSSQSPALSKRVRHAFKKWPYFERSKDLTHLSCIWDTQDKHWNAMKCQCSNSQATFWHPGFGMPEINCFIMLQWLGMSCSLMFSGLIWSAASWLGSAMR